MLNSCFCVNIAAKKPEIFIMFKDDFKDDLKAIKSTNLLDLRNSQFEMFKDADKAEIFLARLNGLKSRLNPKNFSKRDGVKKLLLKRYDLLNVLLGRKTCTTRHYLKDIKRGELFQLYDQTNYVTVKLLRIEKLPIRDGKSYFRYHFKSVE